MQTTQTTATTIANTYERALDRARRSGVRICGRGRRKSDGAPVIAVSSASQPGRWHLVVILPTRLACDCYAGRGGKLCTHRATVHQLLLSEWQKERDRVERVETAKLREALANLNRYHVRLDEALRVARPPLREAPGDAPAITQAEASRLLQRGVSARRVVADVQYPAGVPASDVVRSVWDNRPVTIWKS